VVIRKAGAVVARMTGTPAVALIFRGKQRDWTFPKGHVEHEESLANALIREVREETGLDVEFVSTLPPMRYANADGAMIEVAMALLKSTRDSALRPEHPEDRVRWVELDSVEETLSYSNLRTYWKSVYSIVSRGEKAGPDDTNPGDSSPHPGD
jgi:8-oxo-dGTP diphosphatase